MGSNTFKSSASENMKQIKGLDIEEKNKNSDFVFNTLQDVIEKVEKLEETTSDKIYYNFPPASLWNYSLI